MADGVRNSAAIEAHRGIRFGALDHPLVSETILRTSSNEGVWHAVSCDSSKHHEGTHSRCHFWRFGLCYGTGLGELTKTCMLIECGQGLPLLLIYEPRLVHWMTLSSRTSTSDFVDLSSRQPYETCCLSTEFTPTVHWSATSRLKLRLC